MRKPLHTACVRVMSLARRSSRISSRVPSKPALKNTSKEEDGWRQFSGGANGDPGQQLSELMPYLGVSEFVLSVVNIDGRQQLFTRLLAVDELSLGDGAGIQHAVSAIGDTGPIADHEQRRGLWGGLFSFSFSFLATPRHMEFLGRGSDPSRRCHLSQSCSNARSLTQGARLGMEPAFQQSQDILTPLRHSRNSRDTSSGNLLVRASLPRGKKATVQRGKETCPWPQARQWPGSRSPDPLARSFSATLRVREAPEPVWEKETRTWPGRGGVTM